ncbi:unnamed protein product [Alopecurus aequalis]
MSRGERIEIQAKNIDAAAGEVLGVLEDTSKGNMIYFDGWHGFGASATLRVVAQRLKSSKSKFEKVIHVDCLVWKSMRVLQKAIAEELELRQPVMAIFDRHDEDDDFNGVEQSSRGVIEDIRMKIFNKLLNSTFVVVFHNGSNRYIDLYECGIPVISLLSGKVLWTWHGRFRLGLQIEFTGEEKIGLNDVCLYTSPRYATEELRDLVCEEAEEIAKCSGIAEPNYVDHKVVKQCVLYAWLLRRVISPTGVDLDTHEPNYWICDGIIQGQGKTVAWEIGDSLQRNMRLDWFGTTINEETSPGFMNGRLMVYRVDDDKNVGQAKHESIANELAPLLPTDETNRWVFITHQEVLKDTTRVLPPEVTSCFIFAHEPPRKTTSILPVFIFQHSQSSKLRVLHLSQCTFSFASPPFLCCNQLRFLLLDRCTNSADKEHPSQTEDVSCFQKLWVLDLRYTDWYWLLSEKMKTSMADLRELNIEGLKLGSIIDLCGGRPSLVILRVTASLVPTEDQDTNNQAPFPIRSNANGLKRSSFINDVLPSSLESFSFISKAATSAKISCISFRGCSQLKSILLRGDLGSLEELDLTGTAVKTLDLREVEASNLKRLILLGCEALCAILWPPRYNMTHDFEVLHISTIRSASLSQANSDEKNKEVCSAGRLSSSDLSVAATQPDVSRAAQIDFNRYISVRDPRLLRSLYDVINSDDDSDDGLHMEMDSPPANSIVVGNSQVAQAISGLHQPGRYFYARDAFFRGLLQAGAGNEGAIRWMQGCPPRPTPRAQDWHVHIQVEEEMGRLLEQQQSSIEEGTSLSASLPSKYIYYTRMLHIHHSSTITSIPCSPYTIWGRLEWCRVEGCPKLRFVFPGTQPSFNTVNHMYLHLTTFWASQLLEAREIWSGSAFFKLGENSFQVLAILHLDYCPRLIHVLPLSENMTALPCLESLEIVCCGDLRAVFPLDPNRQEKEKIMEFPRLRHIHLYELPTLQSICGSKISAPNLETVKIRGCWSLRRLPAVSGNTGKRPKVDCEKDWWDNLEWDGVEANHHPSLYEPSHSRYYKKAHLPRGTVLR